MGFQSCDNLYLTSVRIQVLHRVMGIIFHNRVVIDTTFQVSGPNLRLQEPLRRDELTHMVEHDNLSNRNSTIWLDLSRKSMLDGMTKCGILSWVREIY